MCGRHRLTRSQKQLKDRFDAHDDIEVLPRYNIALSQSVVTIRQDARKPVRNFSTMRWGIVPSWAKDMSIGYKTINATAETVATTDSFREPFKSQRHLVPADGFYERATAQSPSLILQCLRGGGICIRPFRKHPNCW